MHACCAALTMRRTQRSHLRQWCVRGGLYCWHFWQKRGAPPCRDVSTHAHACRAPQEAAGQAWRCRNLNLNG